MKIRTTNALFLAAGITINFGFTNAMAAPQTTLPFRSEPGACLFNHETTQTIEATFGGTQVSLPFTGTTSYDFYSPPLAAVATLAHTDKVGGTIVMKNTGTTPANDFHVTGQMSFYDYDPTSGVDTLIASTPASPNQNVKHGGTSHWPLPNGPLAAATTLAAGHLLHVAVTITLASGNPGSFGQLLYDGPDAPGPDVSSTVALFPQNRAMAWAFGPLSAAPDATITASATCVCSGSAANVAQVRNTDGAQYAWTIANGTITGGQGTSQITWKAGSPGSVALGVNVTKYCSSISSATVMVTGVAGTMISVAPGTNGSMQVTCSGTPGQIYSIQATANLAAPLWTTIGSATAGTDGRLSVTDSDAPNFACRFYRTANQ